MENVQAVRKQFAVALDVSRSISNREFTVVEGDTGNVLLITLSDDGTAIDLSGCRVMALFSKSDGATMSQDSGTPGNGVSIGGAAGNEITIELAASSFAPGMVECEIQIYSGSELETLVTTAKFNFMCRRGILNGDTVAAVPQYPLLASLLRDVTAMLQDVVALQGNAQAMLDALERVENPIATTPVLGVLKGTGSEIVSAVAGTDYMAPPTRLTALPPSGTALAAGAEYRVAQPVGSYAFAWPEGSFEAWLKFTTGTAPAITFPAGTTYVGGAPEFEAGKTYELSVKDGVVLAAEVTA